MFSLHVSYIMYVKNKDVTELLIAFAPQCLQSANFLLD